MAAPETLPYMQICMALASMVIIGLFAVVSDFTTIIERGLWYGFDRKAVVAVVSFALGGLIVSAVLKYADSVLKGYATSASVILTGLLSAVFFGTEVDLHFMLAVINVTCSIALYGNLAGGGAHGSSAGKPIAPIQAVAVPPEEDGRSLPLPPSASSPLSLKKNDGGV